MTNTLFRRLAAGELTEAEVALQLGISENEVRTLALAYRLVREELAPRRRRWLGAMVVAAVLPLGFTAWAASPFCAGSLASLYCFQPDQPANATEVNANFATLGNALVNKTGGFTGNDLTSAARLNFTGAQREMISYGGGLATGTQGASGPFTAIKYERVPSGGSFRWYAGGSHSASGAGGGADLMGLSADGLAVNGVLFRQESIASNTCSSSGSCTATCPSGRTIKLAFGFHGVAHTSTTGEWGCTRGLQWLGGCLGNASCTVSTACSSSAVWAECW